jgi:hypothetical protein
MSPYPFTTFRVRGEIVHNKRDPGQRRDFVTLHGSAERTGTLDNRRVIAKNDRVPRSIDIPLPLHYVQGSGDVQT